MQITFQKTTTQDVEQLLFDGRAENTRLYDPIYALQVEIESLHHARNRGKVLIYVNEEIMKK